MEIIETVGWFGGLCGLVIGLVFGSFVGMASWRWPREESWLGRSHCTTCNKNIPARDLVPVLSWLWRRGRSGCCGQSISARYPFIELAVGLPSALIGWHFGISPEAGLLIGLTATLVFLSVVDLDTGLIPDGSHILIFLLGLGWVYLHPPASWLEPVLSFAQTAGVGILLAGGYSWLRKKDMMGWGDVKLMAASAIWLQPQLAPAYLLISAVLGIAFGLWWTRREENPEFPFGPALAFTLLALIGWQSFWP